MCNIYHDSWNTMHNNEKFNFASQYAKNIYFLYALLLKMKTDTYSYSKYL